jgi:hypothetical protein
VRIAVLLLLESFFETYVMFVAGRSNDSRNQKKGSGEDFGEEHDDVFCCVGWCFGLLLDWNCESKLKPAESLIQIGTAPKHRVVSRFQDQRRQCSWH